MLNVVTGQKLLKTQIYFLSKRTKILYLDENILLLHRDGLSRVVIPSVLQPKVLQLLHEAHWGISRMKQMARRYVWRPKIYSDIESMVQRCSTCRTVAKAPDQKYRPWPKTEKPWERIHLVYAGPFFGKMWFIFVDAYSIYHYVVMQNVGQTTVKETISALQQVFAIQGLPDTIVTDNGTQFTSQEF